MSKDPKMLDLVVVVPVFNEQGTIEKIVRAWNDELQKLNISYEIHVYDDGSSDDTDVILSRLDAEMPELVPHRGQNAGHGPTILAGYVANCDRAEWIFQVDSDDEMGPDWFYKLWNIRHDHDFVAGRRYERQSSYSRKYVSFFARAAVMSFYGPSIFDVNCPYRLMRSSEFRACFASIPKDTFAPNVIIAGYAARRNLKTVEVHVPHQSRYSGVVSIAKWGLLKGAAKSMAQTIRYRFESLPKEDKPKA
ncbi:MAG: glycosyltransferase family 2 protein [Verrucomicrobia bacterium]|nr:glycosyltransferase family 2 protein [Verrucomicrobiota bacterium]